ncbi:U3-containing 90S pre-ribosomal complex subunit-domain containing protein [Gongronella butleri]|nr:U3-containing 90S pre-ribosomal complex subunit-domain containing protein [Gongronella butleri]
MPHSATDKKQPVSADAFEDDFVDEEEIFSDSHSVDAEDDALEDNGADRKRKRPAVAVNDAPAAPAAPKKAKKNKKKKAKADPFASVKIWEAEPDVQAAYVADRLAQALPKLTALETHAVPASALVNNTKFTQEHTMDALPSYVKFGVLRHKKLDKAPTENGAPTAIVLTHSAIRATDLCRGLREPFGKTATIGKLFAKHIKMSEQIAFLEATPMHVVVGTPHRVLALAESGHLKLDKLELIVMDTDTTKGNYNLMESLSCREPLFQFINTYAAARLQDGSTKLGIF